MTEHQLEMKIVPLVRASDGPYGRVQPMVANPDSHPALALRAGQRVFCQSEKVGTVRLLLTNAQGNVHSFVMHLDRRAEREVIVPVTWIERADRQQVHLTGERSALANLPTYVADNAIAAAIERALSDAEILNRRLYNDFAVAVRDGTVLIGGLAAGAAFMIARAVS